MTTVYHCIYLLGTFHEDGLFSYCFHEYDTFKSMDSNETVSLANVALINS